MHGFIAILNCSDSDSEGESNRLKLEHSIENTLPSFILCHKSNTTSIYLRSEKPSIFKSLGGSKNTIILGKAFKKKLGKSIPIGPEYFTHEVISEIEKTEGRFLINDIWGQYIVISTPSNSHKAFIMRSPLCNLPVYITDYDKCKIAFSDPADLAKIGIANWDIDWKYLEFKERFVNIDIENSGFIGVNKILSGRCAIIKGKDTIVSNYWPINELCRPQKYGKAEETAQILRETVIDCVGAWASCFDRIGLRLSGGLDSSIVACALRLSDTPAKIWCHTFYGPTIEGDERVFSRAVAKKLSYPLIEIADRWQNQRFDLLPQFPLGGDPWAENISAFRGPTEYPLVEEYDLDAIFSGIPGDGIFYQGTANFAHDELQYSGLGTAFFQATRNAARASKRSVWSIAWEAIRNRHSFLNESLKIAYSRKSAPLMNDKKSELLLSSDIFEMHCQQFSGLPFGKIMQAASLFEPTTLFSTGPNLKQYLCVDPLMSQPLFELCLSIPLRQLVWKGWDRGLARLAFSDILPDGILRREAKGGLMNFLDEVFKANRPLFQEYFKDSELTRAGIIDPEKVNEGLMDGSGQGIDARAQFLITICAEIWVRRWQKVFKNGGHLESCVVQNT